MGSVDVAIWWKHQLCLVGHEYAVGIERVICRFEEVGGVSTASIVGELWPKIRRSKSTGRFYKRKQGIQHSRLWAQRPKWLC
jgi:hypothetical protein